MGRDDRAAPGGTKVLGLSDPALAFTADGKHLAAGRITVFGRGRGGEGGIHVWDLEMGRGIRTLRGLAPDR